MDIIVEDPCIDANRKTFDAFNATEILFPVGSTSTNVNISWPDEVDFVETASLFDLCGTSKFRVNHPSIFQSENLTQDEPQNGVMLSLLSLEDKPEFTKEDFDSPHLLTVQAFYPNDATAPVSDILYQNITLLACVCDDGLVEETVKKTVSVSQ